MQLISENFKKGEVTLKAENLDDLWYLSQMIDKGDLIKGKTFRKMTTGREGESGVRKSIFLEIRVEKVEWSPDAISIRVNGTITQGPEDIPHGAHHTFALEPNSTFTLNKESWLKVQKDRLLEATSEITSPILLVIFDREELYVAKLKRSGYEVLVHEEGLVQKKGFDNAMTKDFFARIVQVIDEYQQRLVPSAVVVASPSFWKEELLKRVQNPEIKKRWILASVSDVTPSSFNELLKRPEVRKALKQSRVSQESFLVEELLASIAKNKAVAYGFSDVVAADAASAVETLLISTNFIKEQRELGSYAKLESLLRGVEIKKGTVHMVSSDHDGGKRLDGISGIAAFLRFRMN